MTGERYTIDGMSVPEELDRLHALFEQVATDHPDLDGADLMLFETAVMEIAGNVVEHGRPAGRVSWVFDLEVTPERLTGELSDSGQEYLGDLSPAMPEALAESGRGLALAGAALDELDYRRGDDANHWTMVRHRSGQR